MSRRGHRAVVCGASMAGLLAARVLAEFYEHVTLVERDVLPEKVIQRKGVPQGRHLHQLLNRGSTVLSELFPGLFDDLVAAGAHIVDDPSLAYMHIGDHALAQHGQFINREAMVAHTVSRPLLEAHVRRRVQAIENVTSLEGHDVVEPILGPEDRVMAVRLVSRETKQERVLDADLVVDATGRAGRTPAFLRAHGFESPAEQSYSVNLRYCSQFFRVPHGLLAEKVALVAPTLQSSTGAGFLAYEDDTAVLTLIGIAGHRPPEDLPGLLSSAAELLPARFVAALRAAEPIGEMSAQQYPASVWRRYDKLRHFPPGLLVLGDAFCSFNPVYGQGMTSAAFQAKALRRCLAQSNDDDLSRRYFRAAAKSLTQIWQANRFNDFMVLPADDWRLIPKRLLNWGTNRMAAAATEDIVVAETFMRLVQLHDGPTRLLRPALLIRIIEGNLRRISTSTR
ncbi:2-polyprenyl-6-methoxyphenol hydroxylase-like oxidoreductase [Mycobacterium sp. NPDC050853]|uniref:FAD-dependent oxidoreductase n=1 Tax=Mycobacterium sp. NPDC050853 TaxID=3155160 RepID=UPI0033FB53C5